MKLPGGSFRIWPRSLYFSICVRLLSSTFHPESEPGCSMDLFRQPTGGIFQDLASFAIFFALREAQFSTFSFGRAKQKEASHSILNDFGLV